ncbi:hypothetical protein DFH28DRAFT_927445 [Melampsora americana]|nr:hypothetical protein DFH28DRAFT_1057100 [Melampsora americana]KAH9816090.1 hypothetical protein DFH28DRAFT_927445 [Melampsora americana]
MSNQYSSVTVFDVEDDQNKILQSDELSFQDYSTSVIPDQHPINSSPPKTNIGTTYDPHQLESQTRLASSSSSSSSWFSIDPYTIYFDVETKTVLKRCWKTMYPKEDYVEIILAGQPDLYGPFWLPTTLIFILFFASSLSGALTAYLNSKAYDYDFTKLTLAVGLVYVYALGLPTCLWLAMRYWVQIETRTIPEMMNLYGYGLTIFIPISILSIPPIQILRTFINLFAFGISLGFLMRNLFPILRASENKSSLILIFIIFLLHLIFSLILWFNFLGIGEEVLISLPEGVKSGEKIGKIPSPP